MTRLDQHPLILEAQKAITNAAMAVVLCERECASIQREIDQNMDAQIEVFTNGGDPTNPLGKKRKPTSFGKLSENLNTAQAKLIAAKAAVQQLEANLTTARLQAREALLDEYRQQYSRALIQFDKALDKASIANQRVLETYQAVQADLGGTPQIENYSWSEFNGFNDAPAGKGEQSDNRLACWKRSVWKNKDGNSKQTKERTNTV